MNAGLSPDAGAFAAETGTEPTVKIAAPDNSAYITSNSANTNNTFTTTTTTSAQKFYTEDDLNRVRSQEKGKLYPEIDALKEEVATLKRERDEAANARAAKEAEKAAEVKAKQEEEMDLRTLMDNRQKEFETQLLIERQEREKAFALLEREKEFSNLQAYKAQRIDESRDNIMPELLDMITGNTAEEIDASIAALTERTARIVDSVQQASQDARRQMVGTRPTLPSTGPLDTETGSRQFTADDIAAMSLNDYAKYRQQLLSPNARGVERGLFG